MMNRFQKQYKLLLLLSFCFVFACGRGYAEDTVTSSKKVYKNLNVNLDNLIKKFKENRKEAVNSAIARNIADKENRVKVIIYPENGQTSGINIDILDKYGAKYRASKKYLYAEVPIENLEAVTRELKNVSYINIPAKIYKEVVTSQGVKGMNADTYIKKGYQGHGVKIAVIDVDFMNYLDLSTSGEFPSTVITQNYTQDDMNIGTDGHGTACAEIIYDLAPQAQLYLIKVYNTADLDNAKDYCIQNGIKVVSMSLGWTTDNFCDGTGDVCGIVDQMRNNGIFFVQAAGNHAKGHWTGNFVDSNTYCRFSTNNTEKLKVNSTHGEFLSIDMTWDAFPLTNENFDLYLYDSNDNQVAVSDTVQQNDTPFEHIDYKVPNNGTATSYYYLKVKKVNALDGHKIRIFLDDTSNSSFVDPVDIVQSMSLLAPADATGAFAVGAIDYTLYKTTGPQESFSSQGPTSDGRIKPDITAPDGVSTVSFGANNSFGTSFAAPHAAGVAAILLSINKNLTASGVVEKLSNDAIDMGVSGKDNIYGSGRVNLPAVSPIITAKVLSTTQIEWQWSTGTYTNLGMNGYKIYTSDNELKKALGISTSFWIETNLSTNTLITRYITAYSTSPASETDKTGISKYTFTSDPYGLSVSTFGIHFIGISWSGDKNSYFGIDRSTDNLKWLVLVTSSAKLNNFIYKDTDLAFSTTYHYRVAAYNGDGIISRNYAFLSKKTQGLSTALTIFSSTATYTQEQTAVNPGVGQVKVDVPPGAIEHNGYIIIDTNASKNPVEVSKTDLDNASAKLTAQNCKIISGSVARLDMFRADGSTVTGNFIKPLQLMMGYPDLDNDGNVDNTAFPNDINLLKIVVLDQASLKWEILTGSTLDNASKAISSDIDHFSIYAIAIILTPGNDLSKVIVFPNPYKPGSTGNYGDSSMGNGIVFENLTIKANIKIYNISGELVKEASGNDIKTSGVYIWDTKNSDKKYVASGVYLYYITNPDNASQKKHGKFAIIK